MRQRVSRSGRNLKDPYSPPEDWHEPLEERGAGYRIVVQPPGRGYRHVVTPEEVRSRLSELPPYMLEPLEVVQLSRITRKKQTFPCYGMQWGATLYLYPIEESLIEYHDYPPGPAQRIEAKMYGGRWGCDPERGWSLTWTESAIKDFYLNNILLHELGHLLDNRNRSYLDRERYAEWFAIEHGYKPSRAVGGAAPRGDAVRRHHAG